MFSDLLLRNLKTAEKVAVLTGAGVSAESGVPTFRGEHGLWKKHRPEELANFDAFMRNPELVWEWYDYRRKLISEVQPNPGHAALTRMEEVIPDSATLLVEIDAFHNRTTERKERLQKHR